MIYILLDATTRQVDSAVYFYNSFYFMLYRFGFNVCMYIYVHTYLCINTSPSRLFSILGIFVIKILETHTTPITGYIVFVLYVLPYYIFHTLHFYRRIRFRCKSRCNKITDTAFLKIKNIST